MLRPTGLASGHLLTGYERDLICEWGRRILSADAGRGHDFEIVWILLICGALGLKVDQAYIGVAERVVSPLVLAVLGLLHADNLLAETGTTGVLLPPDQAR